MKWMQTAEQSAEEIIKQLTPSLDEKEAESVVQPIIEAVRSQGDAAVRAYTQEFDGVDSAEFYAPQEARKEAAVRLEKEDPALYDAIQLSIRRVRAYHEKQKATGWWMQDDGALLGQIVRPLKRVGVYIPGGTAAYPSTVIMNVIPAQVAGVKEIVIATPPAAEGRAHDIVMATAHCLGVERIFLAGGAQAIAALAYGTESCPAVDKITGPGNRFVAAAKRLVYGQVDIDMIAGPSEILIIADGSASAGVVAADLLSQAEHDPHSRAILLTNNTKLAEETQNEVKRQLALLPRKEIAEKAIQNGSAIVMTKDLHEAMQISNRLAPEHLSLQVEAPFDWVPAVENAGSVFVGSWTPEALGDYLAGPNHTLPTAGTARFSSPLSVQDFQKKTSVSYFTEEKFLELADPVVRMATKEGLTAHARAVMARRE